MNKCANSEALNKYMREQEQQEACLNHFIDDIDDDLVELDEMITKLKKIASNYDGYDFSEHLEDMIKEKL